MIKIDQRLNVKVLTCIEFAVKYRRRLVKASSHVAFLSQKVL